MSNRHVVREESWDSLHHSEASNGTSRGEGSTEGDLERSASPTLRTVGDVQRAMHPLQATADRLGKQVEQFAETLDRLTRQRRRHNDARRVLPLIYEYEKIAGYTVDRLKRIHLPEREAKPAKSRRRRSRNSSGRSTPIAIHEDEIEAPEFLTTYEDLQNWEEERQTWRLLGLMLEAEYPTTEGISHAPWHDERFARPAKDIPIHRYSTEQEVWRSYLAEDDIAWERNVVVEWLKTSAEASGASINSLVKQLDVDTDRSGGASSHGWMYTKESIKLAKRMRTWPLPLDPSSPGLDKDLGKPSGTQLITQLDPDAFTRQGRSLHENDLSWEKTSWLICWEMVRRGRSWEAIGERFQERGEVWKALSIRGDPRANKPAAWQSRALWRNICAKAAKNGGIDPYENAVYGVMSGDLLSVEEVAQTCNDFLFAHYNSCLLHSFEFYVQSKFPERLDASSKGQSEQSPTSADPSLRESTLNTIKRLQSLDTLKEEAGNPMKMLQASLIAKGFAPFIHNIGLKLAESANQEERSKIMINPGERYLDQGLVANISLHDHDLLRILTHIILLFRELDADAYNSYAVENVIVAYIDYLGKAGKHQLLPVYASRLSSQRAVECMGRQLPFITAGNDREVVMRLMTSFNMDIEQILRMQIVMIISDTPPDSGDLSFPKLDLLERGGKGSMVMPKVRRGFMTQDITGDQEDLVNGYEWFLMLDDFWQETMNLGTVLYKYLLRTKALSAARKLANTVNFSTISLKKTETMLGRAMDLAQSQLASDDEAPDLFQRSTRSRKVQARIRRSSSARRRSAQERRLLLDYARSFRDLENLMNALDALEKWKEVEVQAPQQRHLKEWNRKLKDAHEVVVLTVEALLGDWLQYPKNDDEAEEFSAIRVAVLPEIILAYISVLNFGGHTLSRDNLLTIMNLAATIAAREDLSNCFMAAGRMAELVDSMAIASKSMIFAEEAGRKKKKSGSSKAGPGESMDIWTVRIPRDQAVETEAQG